MAAQQETAETPKPRVPDSRAEEARSLASEALEAERDGDRAEAKFLKQAASDLDARAAAEVLAPHAGKPAGGGA